MWHTEALVEAKVEGGGEHEDEGACGLARGAHRDAVGPEGGRCNESRLVPQELRALPMLCSDGAQTRE